MLQVRTQQTAFEEAKRAFLVARAQMRELDGKLQEREALTLALQDIQRKLARFRGRRSCCFAEELSAHQPAKPRTGTSV